jgi:RNA polymerase sigma factor (sigma-70 family)
MGELEQVQASSREVQADALSVAVAELFREHNRVLVSYLTSRLRSEQEAKEVAQEAYIRLLQLREPGAPVVLRAYLFKTATNLAIDRLRHRQVQQRSAEKPELMGKLHSVGAGLDDPARQVSAREQAQLLLGFLQELPIKCQEAMTLHRFEGYSQRDAATRLNISERMVRRYVTYAMVYCHLRLEGLAIEQVRQRVTL